VNVCVCMCVIVCMCVHPIKRLVANIPSLFSMRMCVCVCVCVRVS